MKVYETRLNWPVWVNNFLNWLCVDTDDIKSVAVSWGANENNPDSPDWKAVRSEGDRSLFYNGIVFVRLVWPVGFWLHIKWSRDHRFQTGWGWKLNGRFGLTFRFQSTESAARGTNGPNYGQAEGWLRGTT